MTGGASSTSTESRAPAGFPAPEGAPSALTGFPAPEGAASAPTRFPAPEGASAELGASFKGLLAAVRRLRGRETHRHGELSDAQYRLLFGLRSQDSLPSGELALLADVSPAAAAEMLEAMEGADLVERVRSDKDRRVVLTSLTQRGHAMLEARHAQFAPRWSAALSEFSEDELRTAATVLDRLRGLFDDISADVQE